MPAAPPPTGAPAARGAAPPPAALPPAAPISTRATAAVPVTPARDLPKPAAPQLPKPAAPELRPPSGPRPQPPGRIDPAATPPGRASASASARVAPTATTRPPDGAVRTPRDGPPGTTDGRTAGESHGAGVLPPEELWSPPALPRRDSRRGADDTGGIRRENTGGIRRRTGEDTGGVRRRQREEERGPQEPTRRRPDVGAQAKAAGAAPATSHSRRWLTALIAVGVVVVLTVCGLGGYFVINGEPGKPATQKPGPKAGSVQPKDISTRDIDPAPLTEPELFPAPQVTVAAANYQVLKTQATDCPTAATDDLGKLLAQLGCSQVVRATLKSPDGKYLVTAGIFNLKDETGANQAYEQIRPTLDAQKGRFTGLPAGDGTDAIVRAPTTLGWHPRAHFLAYCIVARADSKPIPTDDPGSKQIISDLVEGHLRDRVIGARQVPTPAAPTPTG